MIGLNARQQQFEENNDLELSGDIRNNNMAAMGMINELNDLSSIRDEN